MHGAAWGRCCSGAPVEGWRAVRAALTPLKCAEAGELHLVPGRHSTPHLGQDGTEVASTCARGWPVAAATASINCPRFISSSTAVIGVLAVIVACRKTGSVYDMPGRAVLYHREGAGCRWAPLEFVKPTPASSACR